MKKLAKSRKRRGNIVVLTAVMMVGLMAMLAFALDIGYLMVARSQMQTTADSAALAAAWELVNQEGFDGATGSWQAESDARDKAAEYAALNSVLSAQPLLAHEDVQMGFLANPSDATSPMIVDAAYRPNAVRVRVRRDTAQNGEVPLFFASVLGRDRVALQAEATAAVVSNIRGFSTPTDGSNLGILPITLDEPTWFALFGGGTDNWTWDAQTNEITSGPDGIPETDLYPRGNGPPGNRGTVDFGSNNNATEDIARQILHGLTPQDLAFHGGKLELNENGEIFLNGDTGISAGVKDELDSIKGKPRIIPVFRSVVGPGNNATYTVVAFVGIRVMDVKLTGSMSNKRVIIQPAKMVTLGGIPSAEADLTSYYVYSPAWLVR